jgi:hypothetical protein
MSSSATPVSVQRSNFQDQLGIFARSYYENANASTTGTPTVNTATSIPASSSTCVIQQGTSVYLWTPQFTTASSIPAGKMTVDLWAGPTPEIDGKNATAYLAASGSTKLTTTQTNDVIYVTVAIKGTQTASVSGAGLTWSQRGLISTTYGKIYAFYAVSAGLLSAATISTTLSSSVRFVITAFGVSGVNTTAPFDPNLGSPATATGTSLTPTVTFTTTSTNDFIIGAAFINNNPTITNRAGFTTIMTLTSGTSMNSASEYQNGANAGSKTASFTLSGSQNWAIIGDALVPLTIPLSFSAYTTNSAGVVVSTLVGVTSLNAPASNTQTAATVDVAAGTIPISGYVMLKLTAPTTSDIELTWGTGKPTNFQIAYTYG